MNWPVIASDYREKAGLLKRLGAEFNVSLSLRPRGHGRNQVCKLTIMGQSTSSIAKCFKALYKVSQQERTFPVWTLKPPMVWVRRLIDHLAQADSDPAPTAMAEVKPREAPADEALADDSSESEGLPAADDQRPDKAPDGFHPKPLVIEDWKCIHIISKFIFTTFLYFQKFFDFYNLIVLF